MNTHRLLRSLRRIGFTVLIAVLVVAARTSPADARQNSQNSCTATFQQALNKALQACANIGINQVCLGNPQASASAKPGASAFNFSAAGSVVNADDVASLSLSGNSGGDWGVVMLRLLANLPTNNPGAGVTMVVFGNVQVSAAPGGAAMEAFYLKTAGAPSCEGLPGDGVMIQSPRGQQKVQLMANGVQLTIGSTVFLNVLEADEDGMPRLKIRTLQGQVIAEIDGQEVVIEAGEESGVEIEEGDEENEVRPVGELEEEHPFDRDFFAEFPLDELPDALSLEDLEAEWELADEQQDSDAPDEEESDSGNFDDEPSEEDSGDAAE